MTFAHEKKIVSRDEMAALASAAREAGLTVVFTNGCFDLLHAGHAAYLHEARTLGDMLFVGVNSDRSAHTLKGPGRPFNSENDRAALLGALQDVSAVSIFDEETASDLVAAVQPDIYVKGGDYSADPGSENFPIEGGIASGYGGFVKIIPFRAGYSTRSLVERIRGTIASD